MGAPERHGLLLTHDVERGGIGVRRRAVIGDNGDGQQVAVGGASGAGVKDVLVYRAVLRLEVALVAAGGDGEAVGKGHHGGIAAGGRVLNAHVPRRTVGLAAADIDVAAQRHHGGGDVIGAEDVGHLSGGVAFGNAAQIHGAALVQRHFGVHVDMGAAHQRQQGVDLLLGGDVGRVGGDAPQGHQRGHGHVKGAARLVGESQRAQQQLPRLLLHRYGFAGVETADVAGADGAGEGGLQPVDLLGGGGQRFSGVVAVGGEGHVGVHGEQGNLLRLLRPAGGKGQRRQAGQQQTDETFHSSRRPSSARISVASSANSRWPPTGMP